MHAPTVSIVIPAYNAEAFVRRAFQAVCAQTAQDYECVLVDDSSKDRTQEVCAELCRESLKVRLICQPNRGASGARNRGLDVAKGPFLYFYDADDLIHPRLLEVCLAEMQQPEIDYVHFDFVYRDPEEDLPFVELEGCPWTLQTAPVRDFIREDNVLGGTGVWSFLYRREALTGLRFVETLSSEEDVLFTYTFLKRARSGVRLNVPLYHYCMEANPSITRSVPKLRGIANHWEIIHLCDADFSDHAELQSLLRKAVFPYLTKICWRKSRRIPERADRKAYEAAMRVVAGRLFREHLLDLRGLSFHWKAKVIGAWMWTFCHLGKAEACFQKLFPEQI